MSHVGHTPHSTIAQSKMSFLRHTYQFGYYRYSLYVVGSLSSIVFDECVLLRFGFSFDRYRFIICLSHFPFCIFGVRSFWNNFSGISKSHPSLCFTDGTRYGYFFGKSYFKLFLGYYQLTSFSQDIINLFSCNLPSFYERSRGQVIFRKRPIQQDDLFL